MESSVNNESAHITETGRICIQKAEHVELSTNKLWMVRFLKSDFFNRLQKQKIRELYFIQNCNMACTFIRCYYRLCTKDILEDRTYNVDAVWVKSHTENTFWKMSNSHDEKDSEKTLWVSESFENRPLKWKKTEQNEWQPHFGEDFGAMWKILEDHYDQTMVKFVAHYKLKDKIKNSENANKVEITEPQTTFQNAERKKEGELSPANANLIMLTRLPTDEVESHLRKTEDVTIHEQHEKILVQDNKIQDDAIVSEEVASNETHNNKYQQRFPNFYKAYKEWEQPTHPEPSNWEYVEGLEYYIVAAKTVNQKDVVTQIFFKDTHNDLKSESVYASKICHLVRNMWPEESVEFHYHFTMYIVAEIRMSLGGQDCIMRMNLWATALEGTT